MAQVTIGYSNTSQELRELAASVFEELEGEKPAEKQFTMLAGPNELIQFIADPKFWTDLMIGKIVEVVAGAI